MIVSPTPASIGSSSVCMWLLYDAEAPRHATRAVRVLALFERERPRAPARAVHARALAHAWAHELEARRFRVVADDDRVLPGGQARTHFAVEPQRDEPLAEGRLERLPAGDAARHELRHVRQRRDDVELLRVLRQLEQLVAVDQ